MRASIMRSHEMCETRLSFSLSSLSSRPTWRGPPSTRASLSLSHIVIPPNSGCPCHAIEGVRTLICAAAFFYFTRGICPHAGSQMDGSWGEKDELARVCVFSQPSRFFGLAPLIPAGS